MTGNRLHRLQKNWRRLAGLSVVFAVILGGLVMAQPKPAKAICETPAQSVISLGLWLANSFGFLGDFGGAISNFLIQDVQTGQDETEQRIEDFDENVREGMSEWLNEDYREAKIAQRKQLDTATIGEARAVGSILDADAAEEYNADIAATETDALEQASPSPEVCSSDTIAAGGGTPAAAPDNSGSCSFGGSIVTNGRQFGQYAEQCSNGQMTRRYRECCDGQVFVRTRTLCGVDQTDIPSCNGGTAAANNGEGAGITYSMDAADDIARAIANDAAKRGTANEGTPESLGTGAVIGDKFANTMAVYCDPDANAGRSPCAGDPEMVNKDIEIGSAFLWGDRMTMDLNDERYQKLAIDSARGFVDQNPASAIPDSVMAQPQAVKDFNLTRSSAARKQAVHAVLASLTGTRASRPDIEPLTEVQDIRMAAGVPRENTTDKPSVHEITQALFQDRYTKPEFVTQIMQDPEQLVKNALDIQSGYLMQWNMMYKNMEKLTVMYASEYAQDIEDSEPDFNERGGSGEYDGTINVPPADPDDEDPPECEIVDFEIPVDPFSSCVEGGSDLNVSGWPTGPSTGQISDNMREQLKIYEGFSHTPYWDVRQYSICYGNRLPEPYRPGIYYTDAQCDALLNQHLQQFSNYVNNATSHCSGLTQNQFDALVSFSYNVGYRLTDGSGLSDLISACDFDGAAVKMQEYNRAGGEINSHLVERRAGEAAILTANTGGYSGGCIADGVYCGAGSTDPLCSSDWGNANSAIARCISERDNAGEYFCAQGVANVLLEMGYPITRGNASDWDDGRMEANGWTKINCQPAQCPPGAVLHFDNSAGRVCGVTGGRGRDCGHVEIVTESNGTRSYVSDKARTNFGGSVPDNYTGAYIYTGPLNMPGSIAQQCAQ